MSRFCYVFRVTLALAVGSCIAQAAERPNVVLVITDDQGYGDVAAHGNTMIQTPNLDALHSRSVRLTDFHVDPTCSPTRSALMTGRYSARVGVWHTIMGRSLLRRDEVTMGDVFSESGYRTAMFGKWHLGDNRPFRPMDRGFKHVLRHGGGGVGQTPDYWGNDYFGDTYWLNGKPTQYEGYCTDVWFDGAIDFIESNREEPFFVYLATNAPHGPYLVDEKYSKPYADQGVPHPMAEFYGMITNIDQNMGRLVAKLDELKLTENTLLIFMTDNGTAAGMARKRTDGWRGFNDGMRGTKGSQYDGGHRVPCFFHWPDGKLTGGRDIEQLSAHLDMMPTLIELVGLKNPEGVQFDGKSLVPLLYQTVKAWPNRMIVAEVNRTDHLVPWNRSSAMTERWRLVDGSELYDIQADPGQQKNIAAEHPEVVAELRTAYEKRWASVSERFDEYCRIVIGSDCDNPTRITCHDWHGAKVPWNQRMIQSMPYANGFWAVDIERAGRYRFTLRHQPATEKCKLQASTARLKVGNADISKSVEPGSTSIAFDVELSAGKTRLETWLIETESKTRGAFFIEALRLP